MTRPTAILEARAQAEEQGDEFCRDHSDYEAARQHRHAARVLREIIPQIEALGAEGSEPEAERRAHMHTMQNYMDAQDTIRVLREAESAVGWLDGIAGLTLTVERESTNEAWGNDEGEGMRRALIGIAESLGWQPSPRPAPAAPAHELLREVADAVHEAAILTCRRTA